MKNKFLEQSNILLFTGYVMGKGYNLNELKKNGDKDVIAVLYSEFVEKIKELKEK